MSSLYYCTDLLLPRNFLRLGTEGPSKKFARGQRASREARRGGGQQREEEPPPTVPRPMSAHCPSQPQKA